MSDDSICIIKPEYVLTEHKREISLECISQRDKNILGPATDTPQQDESRRKSSGRVEKKSKELCSSLIHLTDSQAIRNCSRNKCIFLHDIQEYLKVKPNDISDICYNFYISGKCDRGIGCRFGKNHISDKGNNIIDEQKYEKWSENEPHISNSLTSELQQSLRRKQYDFTLSERLIKYNDELYRNKTDGNSDDLNVIKTNGSVTDEDIIKLLQREKKKIDMKDKLVLSPLTTVGNLPFRRICKEFGADVTCGEMAMCTALLQAAPQEWALVKRHHTEDVFGVQLCANNPHLLTKCGQLLEKETNIDFIDLNLGCPIELVYKQGGGCGLLRRPRVLELCIRNLSSILSIPLTIKTRIGVYNNENIAHNLVPKFKEWGASAITVHGRSREQRYTKLADWDYIEQCAKTVYPFPVIGNGDILSYEDYKIAREKCASISGVMIGRGALIKPWIFTEIKEQKLWDISSSERFDIIKKYVNYGLEHWGSDNKGVENTRRFLLMELLSFLYRYVPVGLLEVPPQKINERPPFYKGRDDLETLMASPSASDWIKISEMLLGPVPEGFQFLPKHKANSYK
ncbi:trna-dihydrouridine(47) synthase [nad(p)(+)]-like [Holotrichia oblita]|uniref:Trna-dihydrouridine(47) synthase [nad(P)(+)]-like n=1 Tax=Holotrichia oblita TaxID=644536 RepID=A0ACB9T9E6_HOLOL|nr:trna-dihydrouridine(47) synthase [nad(p)(+)]-like [Holotrichia oblita]